MARVSRRAFLGGAASAARCCGSRGPGAAADGMYVSLNGSLTRQMPWPDFVRLAGKLGYGGVDVNFNAAKTDGVDATLALFKEANVKPAVANLPLPFATPDEAAFQEGLKLLARERAVRGGDRTEPDDGGVVAGEPGAEGRAPQVRQGSRDRDCRGAASGRRSGSASSSWAPSTSARTRSRRTRSSTRCPRPSRSPKSAARTSASCSTPGTGITREGTTAEIVAAGKSRIVHVHVSDAKPAPPEEVRDNQRHMPGEGVIDLVGFFQSLKKIGYVDGVSPEPLGRVPPDMPAEEGARLGLETTLAVMKKAGI